MLSQALAVLSYLSRWQVNAAHAVDNFEKFSLLQSNTADFTRGFQRLVQRIQAENYFVSYFLLKNQPADCVDEQLPLNFALPFMQLNESETIYVRGSGNSFLLAILCIDKLTKKDLVSKFARDLQHIRTRRVLAIHNGNLTASAPSDNENFFRHCMQEKFLHVILIHRDFATTNLYHSYNQFPNFELEIRNLQSRSPIYPNRFENVGRTKLRVLPDQIAPITILHEIGNKTILEGYIGYFLKTFAARYNFQLWLPDNYVLSANRIISMEEIRQAARNNSIDVGASLSTPQKAANLHEYIYPIEFFQWLTMLPVEPPLEAYYFFITIFRPTYLLAIYIIAYCVCIIFAIEVKLRGGNFRWDRSLLLILINPWNLDLLRGFLSQSTAMRLNSATRRIIFLQIFAIGGALNYTFSRHMFNWLTVPPHGQPIGKFSDLAEHNLKILIPEPDIAEISFYRGENFWLEYGHIFKVVKTFEEFEDGLRTMDNRYAYIMDTLVWPITEQRQMYFKHPVFRLSNELYYTKGALLSLPISENSMYKDLLSAFCLRAQENGLLDHWYKMTFFTMLSLGRFNLEDTSDYRGHEVLTLKEFEWVWIAFSVGMGLSGLTFVLEGVWYKFTLILDK
ncbi:unnamed protein product [Ceratitis capitata]|uniref:(Mediterranean fruit fly) hypothetical protein n=1 Tax=Ceratitis capitata TaxID=7213 RepID=A0A811UH23_CERCA|nr:unnamed protein product [Ceratitis capitata]